MRIFFSLCLSLCASLTFCVAAKETYISQHDLPSDPRAAPYLLPPFHPAKEALDTIFSKKERIIATQETLTTKGKFTNIRQGYSQCCVANHKKLPGYLIKVYTDDVWHEDILAAWMHRIEGAHAIRHAIAAYGLEKMFQVPKKWVYPIPTTPDAAPGHQRKDYILIVEDMNIYDTHGNQTLWMGPHVAEPLLDGLYILLTTLGLFDSLYIDNIPFSRNGKVSFIDTEHYDTNKTIPYEKLTPWLRFSMQVYWTELNTEKDRLKNRFFNHYPYIQHRGP